MPFQCVRRLDPQIAAYVAGLVDGNGQSRSPHITGGERRRIVVSISNTDRDLLNLSVRKWAPA